ncbi:hypothetical protein PIB30_055899 [Stylosanthes scabra]|uniref:Uncharacterized protein n=1 Tax=Stylosanthes scabra TaxID=79078 RepID=A0ABU6QJN0_9FABA|nr:hypothetical protein [Stylosanthes scabra]
MAHPGPRHGATARWRLHLKTERTRLFSHSHSQFLSSSPILSIPNPSISHTNTHTSSLCVISLTLHRQMSRRGKDIATGTSTPSRVRTSKKSNRGRGEGFPSNRFDHQLHYDRWKGLENRQIGHERIIRLDGDEERIFRERVLGLGWGSMYDNLIRINLSMVREFCTNFSSGQQEHVFLRGKKIPFTKDNICRHLGIHGDSPDAEVDDDFVALAKAYERGDDMDMAETFSVIGQEGTNWANNPAINTIPKSLNNAT